MVDQCYISSTRTTHKHRRGELIGPCGPCSFINLIGLNGSFKLEKELSEMGRLQPFFISNFTSFLLWAEKYHKQIAVYVEDTQIASGLFDMIFSYEKTPHEMKHILMEDCIRRHELLVQKFSDQIHMFHKKPLDQINSLLDKGFSVAFTMADYFGRDYLIGHWRVCFKKEGSLYFAKDSREGLMKLSEEQMKKYLDNVHKIGAPVELVAYVKE